jgi:hypothetical protein
MSHRYDCPDEWEARRRARSDASYDAENGDRRYRHPYDCDEGNETYRREYGREFAYREEQIAEERAAARRRQESSEREEWEMQQAYEAEQQRILGEQEWQQQPGQVDESEMPF